MKVLLSAYVCEPGKGSEPGVGWAWAVEVASLGHEVWVLTRVESKSSVQAELAQNPSLPPLHFIYYDLPLWMTRIIKGRRSYMIYYRLWQYGAYRFAKRLHAMQRFDLVHHITVGAVRRPSFMGGLGIPFLIGPLGGGERAPFRLRQGYGPRGWIVDLLRDGSNLLIRLDPTMRLTFQQAATIYVRTPRSLRVLPKRFRPKARVELGMGATVSSSPRSGVSAISHPQEFRILFIGRFVHWKGIHLALRAFARLRETISDAQFTIVGRGPELRRLERLADRLGISSAVSWITAWISEERLREIYREHNVMLFPSLHESGGSVVLEAMAHGLPVVCLDLGGPGQLVNNSCGRVVATGRRSVDEVVKALSEAVAEIAENPPLHTRLAEGAVARAVDFEWSRVIRRVYPPAAGSLNVSGRGGCAGLPSRAEPFQCRKHGKAPGSDRQTPRQ